MTHRMIVESAVAWFTTWVALLVYGILREPVVLGIAVGISLGGFAFTGWRDKGCP